VICGVIQISSLPESYDFIPCTSVYFAFQAVAIVEPSLCGYENVAFQTKDYVTVEFAAVQELWV
jgi:hypothetical protein